MPRIAAGGETPPQGEREAVCEISDAQQARLHLQAMTVLDMHARLLPRIFQAREGRREADSKKEIERMGKTCKAHRSTIDMEPGFLDKQL